jgi:hypothetical protein
MTVAVQATSVVDRADAEAWNVNLISRSIVQSIRIWPHRYTCTTKKLHRRTRRCISLITVGKFNVTTISAI